MPNAVEVHTPADLAVQIRGVRTYLDRLLDDPARFATTLMVAARRQPKILECDPASVVGAALVCAQLNLEPGPSEHVWLIPRRNKHQGNRIELTTLLGKNGMKALAERHPDIRSVRTGTIHENDEWEHVETPASLYHKPNTGDRGDPIRWYAIADRTDNGPPHIALLDRNDVEERRAHSASPNKGPWVTHFDAMARKSAIRALWPELPSSLDLERAAALDDARGAITPQDLGVPALNGNGDDQGSDDEEPDEDTAGERQSEVITVQGRLVDAESGEVLAEGEVPADQDDASPHPDDSDGDIGPDSPATDQQLRALLTLQGQREDLDAHDLLQLIHARFDIDTDELEHGLTALTVDQAGQLIAELQPTADDDEEPADA